MNEKELESLIAAIKFYSQDIRIEFSIEKFSILIMKKNGVGEAKTRKQ